jgi:nucleoside-diphosphate-sugar epimerase
MWFGFAAGWCFEMLSKLTGVTPPMTRQNLRSLTADRVFSIDKARRELGYEPRVPPAEGVERTVAWAQQHGLL